jgi:S-adenosylmethionine synthetase
VAKNVVAAGLAERCEVELSYAIGHPQPIGVSVETFGTHKIDVVALNQLVREQFDLSPGGIIRDLRLRRPIYRPTASYGHFGRTDIDAPWEEINRADELRAAAAKLATSPEAQPA